MPENKEEAEHSMFSDIVQSKTKSNNEDEDSQIKSRPKSSPAVMTGSRVSVLADSIWTDDDL